MGGLLPVVVAGSGGRFSSPNFQSSLGECWDELNESGERGGLVVLVSLPFPFLDERRIGSKDDIKLVVAVEG